VDRRYASIAAPKTIPERKIGVSSFASKIIAATMAG